jgi:hypothetical protein
VLSILTGAVKLVQVAAQLAPLFRDLAEAYKNKDENEARVQLALAIIEAKRLPEKARRGG